jgi:hypothetical protein
VLGVPLGTELDSELGLMVGVELGSEPGVPLADTLGWELGVPLETELGDPVGATVWAVRDIVWASFGAAVWASDGDTVILEVGASGLPLAWKSVQQFRLLTEMLLAWKSVQ